MHQVYRFGALVSMNWQPVRTNCIVIVEDGVITSIEDFDSSPEPLKRTVCDLSDCIVLPGFVNNHIHLSYDYGCSSGPSTPKGIGWLREIVKSSRNLTSSQKLAIAQNNVRQALSFGTSFVVENTPFIESVDAVGESPLGALIGWEVFGTDDNSAELALNAALNRIECLKSKFPKLHYTLAPHALYTVGARLLKLSHDHCKNVNMPMLLHLSEFDFECQLTQTGDGDEMLKSFYRQIGIEAPQIQPRGLSPVMYAKVHNCLDETSLLTHLCKANHEDISAIVEGGAHAVSCPRSNLLLCNGLANLSEFKKAGLSVSIGTDGLSSNHSLDPLAEAQFAYLEHSKTNNAISAQFALEAITSIPAIQLGSLAANRGYLSHSQRADWVAFTSVERNSSVEITSLTGDSLYAELLNKLPTMQRRLWIGGQEVTLSSSNSS